MQNNSLVEKYVTVERHEAGLDAVRLQAHEEATRGLWDLADRVTGISNRLVGWVIFSVSAHLVSVLTIVGLAVTR